MMNTHSTSRKKKSPPARIPRIGVLVDTSTTWGRWVCTGIQKYADRNGPWLVFIEPLGVEEHVILPKSWLVDGVIARIGQTALARELRALKRPVVNVSGIVLPDDTFSRVSNDLAASGITAAQHFLDRGFRNFAYFSLQGFPYVMAHQHAFADKLSEAGYTCASYSVRPQQGAIPDKNLDLKDLGKWLKSLPKPVAVLSWNASPSREVLFACQLAGLLVPEEVAILSGCDDDLLCAMAHIPISGIQVAGEEIGYRAAELLDRHLKKKASKRQVILIPPSGIASRRSTDNLAISDTAFAKAIGFVRAHAAYPIQVADIASYSGLSRRALERKFELVLGRSPATEIRRVHVERAKELLATTNMPIPDVAEKSGFGSPEYLSFVFRQDVGQTPLKYRRSIRNR
jgi:LacI family transcriptional regulator